jgi:hypothetical protein
MRTIAMLAMSFLLMFSWFGCTGSGDGAAAGELPGPSEPEVRIVIVCRGGARPSAHAGSSWRKKKGHNLGNKAPKAVRHQTSSLSNSGVGILLPEGCKEKLGEGQSGPTS